MECTPSESLFERLCHQIGVQCLRVPPSHGRTPDFELAIGNTTIVVEVKQLDPTPRERAAVAELQASGTAHLMTELGARVRQAIHHSRTQLRSRAAQRHPAILVVMDNAGFVGGGCADPDEVLAAMYGPETFEYAIPRRREGRGHLVGVRHGGDQGVSARHNRTLSAVAVIADAAPIGIRMHVYHNAFARCPLSPGLLSDPMVCHWVAAPTPQGPRQWQRIDAPPNSALQPTFAGRLAPGTMPGRARPAAAAERRS